MESDEENRSKRNDILSQSYAECVERVVQQKNDGPNEFILPKEILEEREKVWHNFFDKYANAASDKVEIDMNTLKPVTTEGERSDSNDDGEEEKLDGKKDYYSKCRAPLRKLPDLIQYWIDTGNSPYKMVANAVNSETGSSLSEDGQSPRDRRSAFQERSDEPKFDTSRCSSPDTAAYILSNTNTTKKAETLAIIEGAKSPGGRTSTHEKITSKSPNSTNDAAGASPNRRNTSVPRKSLAATPIASKTNLTPEKSSKASQPKIPFVSTSELDKVSSPVVPSLKLSEILPELRQFDDIVKTTGETALPTTGSSLDETSQSSQNQSMLRNSQTKLQNRRRLFTNSDVPVDIAFEVTNGQTTEKQTGRRLHPALEVTKDDGTKKRSFARAFGRMGKKRGSVIPKLNEIDENSSQESDSRQVANGRRTISDSRYNDFFQSLGLTPRAVALGNRRRRRRRRRKHDEPSKIVERSFLPRTAKNIMPINDSIENSCKESENYSSMNDSVLSPKKRVRTCDDDETTMKKLVQDKVLRVNVERLSDEIVARYNGKMASRGCERNVFHDEKSTIGRERNSMASSSSDITDCKTNSERIELITTITHDSDSSTIIICSCHDDNNENKKNETSESLMTNVQRRSLRSEGVDRNVATETEKSTDAFVEMKKLDDNDSAKSVNIAKCFVEDDEKLKPEKKSSKMRFFTRLNSPEKPTTLNRDSRDRTTLNSSMRSLRVTLTSDDDEDSFVKIVSKIGTRDSTKSTKKKSMKTDETMNSSNCQKFTLIATSSDEEDVYVGEDKRRTRNSNNRNSRKNETLKKMVEKKLNNDVKNDKYEDVEEKRRTRSLSNQNKRKNETVKKTIEINVENKLNDDENDDVNMEEDKRRTRSSNGQNRKKNVTIKKTIERNVESELKNTNDAVELDNRLVEGIREPSKSSKISEDDSRMEIDNESTSPMKTRGRTKTSMSFTTTDNSNRENKIDNPLKCSVLGKFTNGEFSASWPPGKQISVNESSGKSKNTKNIFKIDREASSTESSVFDDWTNGRLHEENADDDGENCLAMAERWKNAKNRRPIRDDKKIMGWSFQTCIDADSDTTIKNSNHRTRLRKNHVRENSEERSNEIKSLRSHKSTINLHQDSKMENKNSKMENKDSKMENQDSKTENQDTRRTSQRRLKMLSDKKSENVKSVIVSVIVKEDQRKTRSMGTAEELKLISPPRRLKSSRTTKHSLADDEKNISSQSSPSPKRKARSRTKIHENSMDWQSDDQTDSNEGPTRSSNVKPSKGLEVGTNLDDSKRVNDKIDLRDSTTKKPAETKNLFANGPDNTDEDVDLFFSTRARRTDPKHALVIEKLKFRETPKRSTIGTSSMRFRMKFRSDSDEET